MRSLLHLALSRLKRQLLPQLCVFFQSLPNAGGTLLLMTAVFAGSRVLLCIGLQRQWDKSPVPLKQEGTNAPKGNPCWCSKNFCLAGCWLQSHPNRSTPPPTVCHLLSAPKK